jgi:hypothetical protein
MTRQLIIFSLTLCCLTSCFNSADKNGGREPILSADREAPVGWVVFNAYADNTFEYSLSSRHKYNGTYRLNSDTLFLACKDTTIGIDTAIIREKSVEFFGKKNPRFASIKINKISK